MKTKNFQSKIIETLCMQKLIKRKEITEEQIKRISFKVLQCKRI